MKEITKVVLENEMDLTLAYKQSMRLAELTGLSLASQTTFATAVSEVCRTTIFPGNEANITLYISDQKDKLKYLTAVLEDNRRNFSEKNDEGYKYAKKLLQQITIATTGNFNRIELKYRLPAAASTDDRIVEKWRLHMNTDPDISPYEEIKRKNKQLVEMADRLRESEQQYKTLTDSLPIMIFSVTQDCMLTFANRWLTDYTGHSINEINDAKWENVIHPDDFETSCREMQRKMQRHETLIVAEIRFKETSTGDYRWHTGIFIAMPKDDGTINQWNTFMVDIHAQKIIEQTLKDNKELQETKVQLEEQVTLLDQSNQQLAQFAYITSHDLQEPLRKISFYSDFLKKKFSHSMPPEAEEYFNKLVASTERMKVLIQDVLAYSMVQKNEFTAADLNEIVAESLQDLEIAIVEKRAKITTGQLPIVEGNTRQLKQVFENLISNSLKFSMPDTIPQIDISAEVKDNKVIISFVDNGIGFEDVYMSKMFEVFQKLHSKEKYKGTGIGLAICKKIVELHGGGIFAVGLPNIGAKFIVTLPLQQTQNSNNQ